MKNLAEQEAVINPRQDPGEAPVSPRAILTFARPDFHLLTRLVRASTPTRYLWDCPIREGHWEGRPVTLVGPAVGAPYAVMVLEKLIALGVRMVLVLGWCGSLQPHLQIGAMVLPTTAESGDGASKHYINEADDLRPDPHLCALLRRGLEAGNVAWQAGPIWTTDAFYRETVGAIKYYQAKGVLGVDLELAALFAVGKFRRVPVAGLLVVSDELASLSWRPGYRSARFRQARDLAAHLMLAVAAQWETGSV